MFWFERPSFLSAAWKNRGLPRGVRKISISIIHQIVLWYKPTSVFLGWEATGTYVRWEWASVYLMKHNYLRFRWLQTCHNRHPKALVSLKREILRNSLPSMPETGAGQESRGLWRKGRFPGARVSTWEKHPWVWDHAGCDMGQVWALPLSQLTRSRLEQGEQGRHSYMEHRWEEPCTTPWSGKTAQGSASASTL